MRIRSCVLGAAIVLAISAVTPASSQDTLPADASPPLAKPADAAAPSASAGEVKPAALIAPTSPELKREFVPLVPSPAQTPAPTPGEILLNQTHNPSVTDPFNWDVTIYKSRHELLVYYKGRLFRKYEAVFGRNLDNGAKKYANDRRTPEGVYTIIKKCPSRRFHWFLRLNYPNLVDRQRYQELLDERVVPIDDDGRIPPVGGAIGIHGTDVPVLNAGHINWTTGCISLSNAAIDDLERFLPVGTVVIIKP